MQELNLISPIPPSVNHYIGYRTIMKKGKPMAMSYKTSEAIKYQKNFSQYVISEVQKQGYILKPNNKRHFYIDATFYFDRTDKDPNNYWKCLLDSITDTQLIWLDDNVTCERVQRIYYDTVNPRIELTISPVEYIGIFDSISQLEQFEAHCFNCSRYKRNCSLLNKAKEGRIQSEITDFVCRKYKEK